MRINKYLAESGVASRRAAEEFILAKRVQINGKVITDLATQVNESDIVKLYGKVVKPISKKVYIMLNKPSGYITSCQDEKGRRTVMNLLGDIGIRVFPVGRLDYDTEGLLLLTNDGDFAAKITHPGSQIPKTYLATVEILPTKTQLEQLEKGVIIDDKPTAPAKISIQSQQKKSTTVDVEIIITEGRNRQVRKMFAAVGLNILKLKRTAIADLVLGDLPLGKWKYIDKTLLKMRIEEQ